MRFVGLILSFVLPVFLLAQPASSQDALPGFPFKDGDRVTYDQIEKLKDYLPPAFWENREYFFYEGMEIQIGGQREYGSSDAYLAATKRFEGAANIGRDGALEGFQAGMPFSEDIDCKGDPQAAIKIIWNFAKTWMGDGSRTNWSYTYWDRGEQLPLYYEGSAKTVFLSARVEPQYLDQNEGNIFKNEKRFSAFGVDVLAPFDARGIIVLQYRYKAADAPLDQTRNDDTWVYVPDLRRTRRISTAQRTDSVQGTDFTFDDLRSFSGIPPQYGWTCLDERDILAPVNTQSLAYPYTEDEYNFGPYGFSFANDRWEIRRTWVIQFDPKNDDHPYHHKDIYIDKETYKPLYSFAYDRRGELWKIIWHTTRYSEDWDGVKKVDPRAKDGIWYKGWEGVEKPMDLRLISDIIVNVQTGTGNRIEYWDSHGMPLPSKGKIRRYIDIGRLNKGR
jgi:hypothetical protein